MGDLPIYGFQVINKKEGRLGVEELRDSKVRN